MAALKMVSSNGVPSPKVRPPKFREGQDVVLKGGAQDVMTVEESGPDYTVCIWHDSAGVIQRESLKNSTLRRLSVRERVDMK